MSESETPRVTIARLPTGVPGLDEVLGGGLPDYSFTVIAGAPGVPAGMPRRWRRARCATQRTLS